VYSRPLQYSKFDFVGLTYKNISGLVLFVLPAKRKVGGIYTPLPISSYPREFVSRDFLIELLTMHKNHGTLFLVVDKF